MKLKNNQLKSILSVIFFSLVFAGQVKAQSITNPDFEISGGCPDFNSEIYYATGWSQPSNGDPDYFKTCGNMHPFVTPQNGTGFAGGIMEGPNQDLKEYMVNTLSAPLVAGVTYTISFYATQAFGTWTTGGNINLVDIPAAYRGFFGLCFSVSKPDHFSTTDVDRGSFMNSFAPTGRTYVPAGHAFYTSRNTWVPVTLTYTATGGERYMTVGQFRASSAPLLFSGYNYFLVDNFSPTEVALPVNFSAVGATIRNDALLVNWSTASESNNDHFEIEASADGKTFTKIGAAKSQAVNGTSSTALNYEFSQSASGIALGLGLGLLAIGGMGFSRRKKALATVAIIAGLGLGIAGCQKNDSNGIDGNENIFVRIAQVDKDGAKKYSQVVKAVRK